MIEFCEDTNRVLSWTRDEMNYLYCRDLSEVTFSAWVMLLAYELFKRDAQEGFELTERELLAYSGAAFEMDAIKEAAWEVVKLIREKGGVTRYNRWIREQGGSAQMTLWGAP